MEFTEYDSISDLVLYFNDDITLNFIVMLSRSSKTGERVFNQYETTSTDKYGSPKRSIKRSMNYFFSIKDKNNFGNNMVLRPQDVEMLKMIINQRILPWFIDSNSVFKIKKQKDGSEELILGTIEQVPYQQDSGKYIIFEPTLVFENDVVGRGVRMSISSGIIVDMPLNQFMGFYNALQSDMYAIACMNWAYTKIEPYGVNVYNPKGLGAAPAKMLQELPQTSFTGNSFLNRVEGKRKE